MITPLVYRIFTVLIIVCLVYQVSAQNSLVYTSPDIHFKKGIEFMEKGNYNAARAAFEEYLVYSDDNTKATDAEYYVAYCALVLYHNDGENLVNEFIDKHPSHPKATLANYELGNFYYNERNYDKAIRYLTRVNTNAVSIDKKLETQFKLAYSYFTRKDFDNSIKYFNVIKRQENRYTSAANYYAGYIEFQQEEYDQALIDFKRIEDDPKYGSVIPSLICNVYYALADYDELTEYATSVLDQKGLADKQNIYLLAAEGFFYQENYKNAVKFYEEYKNYSRQPEDGVLYRTGYAYYQLGDYENATENLKAVASSNTQEGIMASYYLGMSYLEQGNKRFAVNAFDRVMNQGEGDLKEKATFLYAKINFDLQESSNAIDALKRFIENYPDSQDYNEANDLLSQAYLNANNYNEAIAHIESLQQMSPGVRKVYQKATFLKGVEYFNKSNFASAVKSFDKSLSYPEDPEFTVRANYWKAEAYSIGRMYDQAIDGYMNVLNTPARNTDHLDIKSYYGLGYAYYNTKVYDQALIYFKNYVDNLRNSSNKMYYDDAVIRLADCYYATRNYNAALKNYGEAINSRYPDLDYALLQTGIIHGIISEYEKGEVYLNRVINEYPDSKYAINALFELGDLYLQIEEYQKAVKPFTTIINKRPGSPFVPYAYLKRATAYYNMQNFGNVIDNYKTFLSKYPTHKEGSNALLGLQEALTLANRLDEFDEYLQSYKKANPDQEGLESVEFETARNQYFNQNYTQAIRSFKAFIEAYPDDVNTYEAKYYIAECYYRLNQPENALEYYNQVLEENKISNISRVLHRMAELEYEAGRYENALYFYHRLGSVALTKKQEYTAWSGLMKTHFVTSEYDSVEYYSKLILQKALVSANAHTSALLHLGKAAFARGQYEKATQHFNETIEVAKDENAAEANYLLAQIAHNNERYEDSNEMLYDLHKSFAAFQYWYDKSFLLIADNFIAMEEYFQATETLNSLIDNTSIKEIKDQAEFKIKNIEEFQGSEGSQRDSSVVEINDK